MQFELYSLTSLVSCCLLTRSLSCLVWTLFSRSSLVSCYLLARSLPSLVWTLPPDPYCRLFCDWSLHCSTTWLLWLKCLFSYAGRSLRGQCLSMRKALLVMNMIRSTYIPTYTLPALCLGTPVPRQKHNAYTYPRVARKTTTSIKNNWIKLVVEVGIAVQKSIAIQYCHPYFNHQFYSIVFYACYYM